MGRWASTAVEAARQAGLAESHHVTTFEDTVALLLKRLAPGDAVLVKGSRGMRMERVVDALVARFGTQIGLLAGVASAIREAAGWNRERVGKASRVLVEAAGN